MRSRLGRAPALSTAFVVFLLPVFFDPFAAFPFEPAKVDFFRFTSVLSGLWLLAAHAFGALEEGPPLARNSRLLLLAAALLGTVQIAATVSSLDPSRSAWGGTTKHGTATWLVLFTFFFVVTRVARSPHARALISRMLVAGSVPVMVYGFIQFLGLDPLRWETDSLSPIVSTLGRSNFVGAYLAVIVPFTLAWSYRGGATVARALLMAQCLCLFLTQARAAWLAALVGTSIYLYLSRSPDRQRQIRRPLVALAASGLVLLAIMSVVDFSTLGRSAETTPVTSVTGVARDRANTALSRLDIWSQTLAVSKEHWLLGHGPETFPLVFDSRALVPSGELVVEHPHNILLSHLFSSGVLGLAAFLFLVVRFFASWPSLQRERVLGAAIVGSASAFLVQAQLNPEVIVTSFLFWLNLGLAAAAAVDKAQG